MQTTTQRTLIQQKLRNNVLNILIDTENRKPFSGKCDYVVLASCNSLEREDACCSSSS